MQPTVFNFNTENTGGIGVLEVVDRRIKTFGDNPLAMRYRQLLGSEFVYPSLLGPVALGERMLKGARHQGASLGNR
jgi:hypothetical protein